MRNGDWHWNCHCHQLMLTLTLTPNKTKRDFPFGIFEAMATVEQMMMTMLWFHHAIHNSPTFWALWMLQTIFMWVNPPDRDWPKFAKRLSLWQMCWTAQSNHQAYSKSVPHPYVYIFKMRLNITITPPDGNVCPWVFECLSVCVCLFATPHIVYKILYASVVHDIFCRVCVCGK